MGSKSDQNSLSEKSMKVVTNMIRMSSFSLSHKTLGTCRSAAKDIPGSDKVPEREPLVVPSQSHGSRRLLEPQSRSNPTYVIKPAGNNGLHSIHKERIPVPPKKEDSSVDGLATDYIRKIRKQLGCGLIQDTWKPSSA
ncbi:hypothetical protein L6164_014645 [Bauhinia variegata]|uniref:Uncharacterized protein n=1 Tax=Bauhinia variegata TaxID=167791 RepID=A0ACB9NI63_BAUVA|nr:hypothetical protein L6164_014645 [Bauhinia variegata]